LELSTGGPFSEHVIILSCLLFSTDTYFSDETISWLYPHLPDNCIADCYGM